MSKKKPSCRRDEIERGRRHIESFLKTKSGEFVKRRIAEAGLPEIRPPNVARLQLPALTSPFSELVALLRHRTPAQEPAAKTPRLSASERDIVAVLRKAGRRLTTARILSALEEAGLPASEGMLKQTLAAMRRHGLLTNDRNADPPGYGLPEWDQSKQS